MDKKYIKVPLSTLKKGDRFKLYGPDEDFFVVHQTGLKFVYSKDGKKHPTHIKVLVLEKDEMSGSKGKSTLKFGK